MIKIYFKLALKSIISQLQQSVLNSIGLGIALSCGILILLYVQYELSYDNYHKNGRNIYRVITKQSASGSYMGKDLFAVTPASLKTALSQSIPEVKSSTKCRLMSYTLEFNSSLFMEKGILFADTDFLKIFTFPVISGNPVEGLNEPFALFITKEMAAKYFGTDDPIGKILKADNKYLFTVRGVLENIPSNSHFDFDFLTGFETLYVMRGGKEKVETWNNFSYSTYVQLLDDVTPEEIKGKLKDLTENLSKVPNFTGIQWIPVPLRNIHLGGKLNFDIGNNNDVRYLYLIISIGVFILLIACLNYMNMATARAYSRGRETGILKVAGSNKTGLIIQFVMESVLLTFGGLILALAVVTLILPPFSNFTERPLTIRMIIEYNTLLKVIALTILTGILAGIYPAFHLSSISPINLIKEDYQNLGGKKRSGRLRNLLVVLQYTISVVALICTFTMLNQLNFIRNTDFGFKKDSILAISLKDPAIRKRPEIFISEISKDPKVEAISTSWYLPSSITESGFGIWDGKPVEKNIPVFRNGVGINFIDFYDLKIVSGRGFSNEFTADSTQSYILNETAIKMIGWDNPVGKKFGFDGSRAGKVIGVVKDFNFQSLHLAVEPLALSLIGGKEFPVTSYIFLRVNPVSLPETRLRVEQRLKALSPGYLNPVSVLSDEIDAMYRSDKKLSIILVFSTVLAVMLTCLGQYSLTSYSTKSRTKEMVIRKIMGSQPSGIMLLLTAEIAKWILISIFIAWPIAYLLMTKWLQNFAFHIKLGAGVFLYSLLITLMISLIAVSYHVITLSKVNPAGKIRIS